MRQEERRCNQLQERRNVAGEVESIFEREEVVDDNGTEYDE